MKETIQKKLHRLNADTANLHVILAEIPEEKLNDQSYGWSILQVLSHLNDAETASLKYMQKKMQAGDKMKVFGTFNRMQLWLSNHLLQSALKWKAPSYISTPPQYSYIEIKEKWAQTREAIGSFVDEYPDQWLNKLVYKHPIAGRQNLNGAVDSFVNHQIHHLHQIKRIRKKINA